MPIACELSNACFNRDTNDKVEQSISYDLQDSGPATLLDCRGHGLYENRATPNGDRSRRAHAYSILSPGKAQPRSRSTSSEPSSADCHQCPRSKTMNPKSSYTVCVDKNSWHEPGIDHGCVSPKGVCLFIPSNALKTLSQSKCCLGSENLCPKSIASFGIHPETIARSPRDERKRPNGQDNMLESFQSNQSDLTIKVQTSDNQLDLNSRKLLATDPCFEASFCRPLHKEHVITESPERELRFSHCESGNHLALFSTDIYRVNDCDKAVSIQQNKNTNSGVTTHKPISRKNKARHRVSRSHSSSPCSVKSNSSWEDNGAYDDDYSIISTSSKRKNRITTRPSKQSARVLQTMDKHASLEPKQFWERITRKLKPNEIAIGVGKKSRNFTKSKPEVKKNVSGSNSHLSNCKNNSSYISTGTSLDTSSRRCRSTCGKPNPKRSISPRGISVNASSSDEASQRHKKPAGRTVQIGRTPKAKGPKPTPPRAKSKSPISRGSKIPVSRNSKSPSSKSRSSTSRSKSPVSRGKSPGTRGNSPATRPRSPSTRPKSPASKGKSSAGKRSQSKRASSVASRESDEPGKPTKHGKKRGDIKKTETASPTQLSGIVPLTPAEICERCKKYRVGQEIGECVPLDFSHVQQLERLAETVDGESSRELLKIVTAIVEEKVCKQMFRYLMPCDCPGCKNRPNICESLDKFFAQSTKASKGKSSKSKSSGKSGKKKTKGSPKAGKQKSGSPDSVKKKKGRDSSKTKESKSDNESRSEVGDEVCGDSCAIPSLACCRTPPWCVYDRDYCCGRNGCRYTTGWSNASMRLGWWPGNRARYSHFDRCWSNHSGHKTAQNKDDSWLKPEFKHKEDYETSKENSLVSRERGATDEANNNIKGTCFLEKDEKWAVGPKNLFESQELFPIGTRLSRSDKKMSDFFRRYCTDSPASCPHDDIEPSKSKCQKHSLAAPSFYTDPSKVRDHTKASGSELPSRSWGKLVYGDEESVSRLDAFISSLDNISSTKEVGQENDSKNISPNQGESGADDAKRHRSGFKKRKRRNGPASQNSSPTSKAIGELEARTKALLSEVKLGCDQTNASSSNNPKQVSQDAAGTSFIREYSPISPPDVNTAYSTNQSTQAVNKTDGGIAQVTCSTVAEKLWWDGLPEKTTRTFNSVLLKKYTTSSAMPVSVEAIGKSQPAATESKSIALQGRSRSEPRLTQTNKKSGDIGTPRNSQTQDKQVDSARKTGSYTVCKGRPGKQNLKGKSGKKLWKY